MPDFLKELDRGIEIYDAFLLTNRMLRGFDVLGVYDYPGLCESAAISVNGALGCPFGFCLPVKSSIKSYVYVGTGRYLPVAHSLRQLLEDRAGKELPDLVPDGEGDETENLFKQKLKHLASKGPDIMRTHEGIIADGRASEAAHVNEDHPTHPFRTSGVHSVPCRANIPYTDLPRDQVYDMSMHGIKNKGVRDFKVMKGEDSDFSKSVVAKMEMEFGRMPVDDNISDLPPSAFPWLLTGHFTLLLHYVLVHDQFAACV